MTYTLFNEKSSAACRYLAIIACIAAPMSTAVTSVASALLLLAWLGSGEVVASLKRAIAHPVGKMILVFYAWLLIGTLYAHTSWGEKLTTLLSWKKLLYGFLMLGMFYQEHWKRLFIKSYFIAMIIAAIVSTVLWAVDVTVRNQIEPGIFMTNHSSQSIGFVAATLCGIFLWQQPTSPTTKWLIAGAIALFVFNVFYVSTSRSGYVALPVALVSSLLIFYGYKKLPHIIALLAILLVTVLLSSNTLQQRIKLGLEEKTNYRTSENTTSIGIRVIFVENTVELIKQQPLFGYGTSSFKPTYAPYAASKHNDWRGGSTTDPHNQYLFIWLENGIIGVLLFLTYIAVTAYQGVKHPPYGGMATSFVLAIAAVSLFNSNFKTFSEGFLVAFFTGILLAGLPKNPDEA